MKRFLHALAALWPKRKEVGNPPTTPTSNGLRQHLAAVLRIEGYLSECTDIHSRKRNAVTSDTLPARREEEWSGSMYHRTECDHVGHPSSKAGSQTVGITERNAVTSRQVKRSGSPNQQFVDWNAVTPGTGPARREGKRSGSTTQPQSLPRIPQPMPLLTILMLVFFMCLMAAPSRAIGTAAFLDSIPESVFNDTLVNNLSAEYDIKKGHHSVPHENKSMVDRLKANAKYNLVDFPLKRYVIDTAIIEKIKIGDNVPVEWWYTPMEVVTASGRDTVKLIQYRDAGLLVIDFWAGWCAPCVKSMDKWENIVDNTGGEVVLLGAVIDYAHTALPWIRDRGWNSASIIGLDAHVLNRYIFDRNVVGKALWIRDSKVVAISGNEGFNIQMIDDLLSGRPVTLPRELKWTHQFTLKQ